RPSAVADLRERVRLYREVLGYPHVEFLDRPRLERDGYLRGAEASGALRTRNAFGLHPLQYVRGLAAAALRRGATLCERSPVVGWRREGSEHVLVTPRRAGRTRTVVMATNGYTPESLHPFFRGRVLPATSNIIVTRPLTAAEWRDVGMLTTQVYSDTRKLLFYWRRLSDDRLLFGGRAGVLDTPAGLRRCRRRLEAHMVGKWPALRGVASEYFWSGTVCLWYALMPHVNRVDGVRRVADVGHEHDFAERLSTAATLSCGRAGRRSDFLSDPWVGVSSTYSSDRLAPPAGRIRDGAHRRVAPPCPGSAAARSAAQARPWR